MVLWKRQRLPRLPRTLLIHEAKTLWRNTQQESDTGYVTMGTESRTNGTKARRTCKIHFLHRTSSAELPHYSPIWPVRDRFCLIERVCTRNPASLDRRSANIRLVQSIVLSDLVLSHPQAAGLTSNDSTFCLHCLLLHHLRRVTAMEDVGRTTRWGHSGICTVCRFWLCHVFMGCFRVCILSLASFFS